MKNITYSKNVFIPLTTVCRNDCGYCHFKDPLNQANIMSFSKLNSRLKQAKKAGCTEVLFTCGSQPEGVADFSDKLYRQTGFDSWISFVIAACREALRHGLLPHSNIGVVSKSDLRRLADYNASLGLMLETTADLEAHQYSPTKSFSVRRDLIATAGQLKIPFTSGLLLGIGESRLDRRESLEELKKLAKEYGHLQEVILQPVVPPANSKLIKPRLEVVVDTVQLAADILPEDVAIQVPPNLVDLKAVVDVIDDIGGISSVTDDYINPSHQWPKIRELEAEFKGVEFKERLPIYPQYLNQEWVRAAVWKCLQSEEFIYGYKEKRNFN
ncbi:MAG: 7,8-didemethyl-8-hydroxy-5-deazariboflavin synthase subunit CofG [Bacillota bacterium]